MSRDIFYNRALYDSLGQLWLYENPKTLLYLVGCKKPQGIFTSLSWFSVKWRLVVLGKALSSVAEERRFSRHRGLSSRRVLGSATLIAPKLRREKSL